MQTTAAPVAVRPTRRRSIGVLRAVSLGAAGIGIFVAIWHLMVGPVFNPVLVPTPVATVARAGRMIASGELFQHIGISLQRVLIGYVIGCVGGIVLGALIGRIRTVRELTDPLLELVRPISPVAMVPLALLWFGIGELSKYFIIVYATLIVVLLNTAAGVSRAPLTRIRAAQCLGATPLQVFLKVVLPSAVPFVLTGMRVALGFSFMGIVAAELIGAKEGIGFLIMNSQMLLQTEQLFVGLLTLGVVGLLVDRVFRWLLARSMRRYMQHHYEV